MLMAGAPIVQVLWHQTNQFARNVAPFQNLTNVAFAQESPAFSRRRWDIGLKHLPSNPIAHRAQPRAVSVPQDAQTRFGVRCDVGGVAAIVMNLYDAARERPSRHAVSKASCWLRPTR